MTAGTQVVIDWISGLGNNKWWTLLLGMAWIALMAFVCYVGIEIAAAIQYGAVALAGLAASSKAIRSRTR